MIIDQTYILSFIPINLIVIKTGLFFCLQTVARLWFLAPLGKGIWQSLALKKIIKNVMSNKNNVIMKLSSLPDPLVFSRISEIFLKL